MPGRLSRPLRLVLVAASALLLTTIVACRRLESESADDAGEPTFNRDIAPIVFEKCSTCHRPAEAAPFPLLTYEDVRRRAGQIAKVTRAGLMPPWLPTAGHGEFVGARRLSEREIETFAKWAATGAPRGDEEDLPLAPAVADEWQSGPPDAVLETQRYTLAGEGADVFRNFVVPIRFDEPRWVQSIELRPTNPRVMHHARLGVDDTYESIRRDAEDDAPGYDGMAWGQDPEGQLINWVPGMIASHGTPGAAWRLHPKTSLVLHTHMQPSGKPEAVQFRIGVYFAKQPPQIQPVMLRVGSREIDIPAGSARHVLTDEYTLPVDVDVHSIFPHAHSLCCEARVTARRPDGAEQPLIWIERFDEKWHDNYRYAKPVRLARGTTIVSTFAYDNTQSNVRNRHRPPRRVVYGSNADDEMADVYLQVIAVHADQRAVLVEDYAGYELRSKLAGFRKTLAQRPSDPWSQEGLAACYFALKKPQEAIRTLEARLKNGPSAVHPVVSLGLAYFAIENYGRAEELHRQALSMDAEYPLAWLGLGKALEARTDLSEAERAYRRAIELAPSLTEARWKLAELLLRQGHLDEAASMLDEAIKFSPDNANSYLKLAEICAKQGRREESLRHLETACRLAPYTHPPKVLLAVYLFQSGDSESAGKLLRDAHAELPAHPVPALFLGQLARRERQAEASRKYLELARRLAAPENWPPSHKQRFLVLLCSERFQLAQQLEDAKLARDALEMWVECEPENKRVRELYNQLRAEAK